MAKNELGPLAKQLWGLAIAQGVLAILFGILALFWPGLTVALLIVLFSVFVLVWGVVGVIVGLSTVGTNKFWWVELLFSLLAVGLAVFHSVVEQVVYHVLEVHLVDVDGAGRG
jgi:uncharacterized membrane protein HdeD (DUF308 family)